MEKEPKNKMDTKKEYLYAYILATSSWKRKTGDPDPVTASGNPCIGIFRWEVL